MNQYFATCPKGIEGLLKRELEDLGATKCRETVAGVYFDIDYKGVYKVCLWSRLANRVLNPLISGEIKKADDLYEIAKAIPWDQCFVTDASIYIDFTGTNGEIRNTQFGAQLVKDAVVDVFKLKTGTRPSVSKQPDVRINVRLARGQVYFALDMSGESLHRRGYRQSQGAAPLKENLAAAILMRSNWSDIATEGGGLIDPMCGSGTFLVEAGLMALEIAPGLYRTGFGFEKLNGFDPQAWGQIKQEALSRKKEGLENTQLEIRGYDENPKVIAAAEANINRAGLSRQIKVMRKALIDFKKPTHREWPKGLLICNPPYGERLGEINALRKDYQLLGQKAKEEMSGWDLAVFTGNEQLGRELRLRPKKTYKLFNGPIASQLLVYDLVGAEKTLRRDDIELDPTASLSEGAQMVFNRMSKNHKRMSKWIKHNAISCYRIYDADIPEYAAAIDFYEGAIHIQEYQAPRTVDEVKAQKRFREIVSAAKRYFNVGEKDISLKVRKRNRGKSQYEKNETFDSMAKTVREGPASLHVNLTGYLDTGLFLDHRPLRMRILAEAKGKKFLNLFCYTATASVQAALGGAISSTSVDMSNTYLEWASKNFALNNIHESRHHLVREDCVKWLQNCREGYDLIMLDPPSFSNSKKMDDVLDVQRDHVSMINRCMDILNPGGALYFSTNLRSFKLDQALNEKWRIEDISHQTLDPDFKQNPKIHYCWKISVK